MGKQKLMFNIFGKNNLKIDNAAQDSDICSQKRQNFKSTADSRILYMFDHFVLSVGDQKPICELTSLDVYLAASSLFKLQNQI